MEFNRASIVLLAISTILPVIIEVFMLREKLRGLFCLSNNYFNTTDHCDLEEIYCLRE